MEKYGPEWREWNAVLFEKYRKARPFAGLKFFTRTSEKNRFLIVSRHYPWELCWSWIVFIVFRFPSKGYFWAYTRHLFRCHKNCNGHWTIWLRLFFCEIEFSSQNYGPHITEQYYYPPNIN